MRAFLENPEKLKKLRHALEVASAVVLVLTCCSVYSCMTGIDDRPLFLSSEEEQNRRIWLVFRGALPIIISVLLLTTSLVLKILYPPPAETKPSAPKKEDKESGTILLIKASSEYLQSPPKPKKGEFEKSNEYELRLQAWQTEVDDWTSNRHEILDRTFELDMSSQLDFNYCADSEILEVRPRLFSRWHETEVTRFLQCRHSKTTFEFLRIAPNEVTLSCFYMPDISKNLDWTKAVFPNWPPPQIRINIDRDKAKALKDWSVKNTILQVKLIEPVEERITPESDPERSEIFLRHGLKPDINIFYVKLVRVLVRSPQSYINARLDDEGNWTLE